MKVNYTLWHIGPSGGVRVIFKFAEGLARRGHIVTITSLTGDACCYPSEKVEIVKARVPQFYKYVSYASIKFGFPLISSRFLMNVTPLCDINIATLCLTAFAVQASENGIPLYHMQHYEAITMPNSATRKIAERSYSLPITKIANSLWLRGIIRRKFGETPPVINPGIDVEVFHSYDVVRNDHKKRVVCFGTSLQWKGIYDLFDALKILKKSFSNLELVMYGSTPQLRSESPVPSKYVSKPNDRQLAELYSSADVVVCPSWCESFPLPPLEAMACGAPVVTTRIGTEDYAFNEENSLVVPPRKPQLLADAICKVLFDEDLQASFRKKGRETAAKFTWDKALDKAEVLFRKTMKVSDDLEDMVVGRAFI